MKLEILITKNSEVHYSKTDRKVNPPESVKFPQNEAFLRKHDIKKTFFGFKFSSSF